MSVYVRSTAPESQRAAAKEIQRLLDEAQKLVYEAESLADEHDLEFSMNLGCYGMGGSYSPVQEGDTDEWGDPVESGWSASSQSC